MLLSDMGLTGLTRLSFQPEASGIQRALEAAHRDIGVREKPKGSNRGKRIDEYNEIAQAPLASFWCASAVTAWWKAGSLEVPPIAPSWWTQHKRAPTGPASCDAWKDWALITNRWSHAPIVGAAVVYGHSMADASHIGILLEWDPADGTLLSIEGNTTLDGYSRNGDIVTLKAVRTERLLGYIHPFPVVIP